MIISKYHPELKLITKKYRLGKPLKEGQTSNALYAVKSVAKDIVLRISICKDTANLYACDESRTLQECYLL